MIKKPVTIQANMDMEARPIAHLVQEASQYSSKVYIELDEKKINAKSFNKNIEKYFADQNKIAPLSKDTVWYASLAGRDNLGLFD